MSERLKLITYSLDNLSKSPYWRKLSPEQRHHLRVVAQILPFKVNNYVLENLINFDDLENDPMFTLCFLRKDMIGKHDFEQIEKNLLAGDDVKLKQIVHHIRGEMNPHPAGQATLNLATIGDQVVPGVQHKYKETVLVFPAAGQTCFTYCSFCFRWAQFVDTSSVKFQTDKHLSYLDYLRMHKEVTDVLVTGGDPMIMSAKHLRLYLEPLLSDDFSHIQNVRVGSKVLSYWPHRFTTDPDSDAIIALFDKLVARGKNVSLMAHLNHPRELETQATGNAIKRILSTGATIRGQSPLLRGVNDDPRIWKDLWNKEVQMGVVPYYMFAERDTGPKEYFQVPLVRAFEIFRDAYQNVSGLARTVRGPSMSCFPGKVCVEGTVVINGQKLLALKFLQARDPKWCNQMFFARWDENATWFDQLKPAFGERKFFFEHDDFRSGYAKLSTK